VFPSTPPPPPPPPTLLVDSGTTDTACCCQRRTTTRTALATAASRATYPTTTHHHHTTIDGCYTLQEWLLLTQLSQRAPTNATSEVKCDTQYVGHSQQQLARRPRPQSVLGPASSLDRRSKSHSHTPLVSRSCVGCQRATQKLRCEYCKGAKTAREISCDNF
jgi:hypothetical protein